MHLDGGRKMRGLLIALFTFILLAMIAVTVYASLEKNVLDAGPDVRESRWFQATLVDTYFGFLTFYVWVAYKERSWIGRLAWFVAIMGLGNMAMAVYMLMQLVRWDERTGAAGLLLRHRLTVVP
jgi:hypothetical protein